MNTANIFDIKRFGINDGGGIRTVVFIKGCPLNCKWCHNPEGISPALSMWCVNAVCVKCGECEAVCQQNAITIDGSVKIDDSLCIMCGECAKACPTGAMKATGASMSVDDVLEVIERDMPFYGERGGVTLSGGECTSEPEFSLELLARCKQLGINTAIETSMFTSQENLLDFAKLCDELIVDIKLIDSAKHKELTGAPNEIILDNFKTLARAKCKVLVRIPLIPDCTDSAENLEGIAKFIKETASDTPIELINFNPMCVGKYASLGQQFIQAKKLKPYTMAELEQFSKVFSNLGLHVSY